MRCRLMHWYRYGRLHDMIYIAGCLFAAAQKLQSINICGEGDHEVEELRSVHGLLRNLGAMTQLSRGCRSRRENYGN